MPNDLTQIALLQSGQTQGTARAGAELREVRERLGWKLADVSATLRIRLPFLEAIERGDLGALPGVAYQTGFIRTYAQALGLDPEEILRRFRAEGMGIAPKAELSFPAPVPDRAVPTGAIVLLGVVLVLVGYGLWFRHTEQERLLADAVPAIPAELAPLALPKPVIPPAPPKAAPPVQVATAPVPVPVPSAPAAPVTAASAPTTTTATTTTVTTSTATPSAATPPAAAPPVAASAAAVAQSVAKPVSPAAPSAPVPAHPAPVTAPTAAAAGVPASAASIVASADSWVEVQDATGTILFSRVLHAGESWPIPDEPGLTLTSGNAGGTEIAENGKTGPALGSIGVVLHNYPLTPSAPKAAAN